MELSLATQKVKTHSALPVALPQLPLLVAIAYGTACMVPAGISFDCGHINAEQRSSAFTHVPRFDLHAELICESALPHLSERATCNLPK